MRTRTSTASSRSSSDLSRVTLGHRHAWKTDALRSVRCSGDVGGRAAARTQQPGSENAAAPPAHRLLSVTTAHG